jgi:hypothetical protein
MIKQKYYTVMAIPKSNRVFFFSICKLCFPWVFFHCFVVFYWFIMVCDLWLLHTEFTFYIYNFPIRFRNCHDGVVFLLYHLIVQSECIIYYPSVCNKLHDPNSSFFCLIYSNSKWLTTEEYLIFYSTNIKDSYSRFSLQITHRYMMAMYCWIYL